MMPYSIIRIDRGSRGSVDPQSRGSVDPHFFKWGPHFFKWGHKENLLTSNF